MSRVVSFSTDNEFADNLENLIKKSGYKNRSYSEGRYHKETEEAGRKTINIIKT